MRSVYLRGGDSMPKTQSVRMSVCVNEGRICWSKLISAVQRCQPSLEDMEATWKAAQESDGKEMVMVHRTYGSSGGAKSSHTREEDKGGMLIVAIITKGEEEEMPYIKQNVSLIILTRLCSLYTANFQGLYLHNCNFSPKNQRKENSSSEKKLVIISSLEPLTCFLECFKPSHT